MRYHPSCSLDQDTKRQSRLIYLRKIDRPEKGCRDENQWTNGDFYQAPNLHKTLLVILGIGRLATWKEEQRKRAKKIAEGESICVQVSNENTIVFNS